MAYMLVQHEVADFDKWKKGFDAAADMRSLNGELSAQLFRGAGEPEKITALFKWDSIENAKKYSSSPELKAAMEKAGVTGPPSIYFLNEA